MHPLWDLLGRAAKSRACIVCLWALVALFAIMNILTTALHAAQLGVPWQSASSNLLDYRDIVVSPGRFLRHGGNPYDPSTYLVAHPWAQEFDPYAPSWFAIASVLCWLPVGVGGAIYLTAGTMLTIWEARLIVRFLAPDRLRSLAVPCLVLWLQVWFPTRTLGSSALLTVAATYLFTRLARKHSGWTNAVALSVLLVKPQIGVVISVLLFMAGQVRLVLRGWFLMLCCSLPAGLACVISAGGLSQFIESLQRDVNYASSPSAPTGLISGDSYRVDLPGLITRVTHSDPSTVVELACIALVLVPAVAVALRGTHIECVGATSLAAMILLPVHLNYDMSFMLVSAAFATHLWIRTGQPRDPVLGLMLASVFPVVHLHRISGKLGIARVPDDVLDVVAVLLVLLCGVVITFRGGGEQVTMPQRALLSGGHGN